MKKKIKLIIYYFLAFFSIVTKILFLKNKKKINFFVQTEGGFGPSITRTHLINYMYENDWIVFFGTKGKRHNKKISKIFNNRLKFFFCGDLNQPTNQINFEKNLQKFLFFFFKIKITPVSTLISKLEFKVLGSKTSDLSNKKTEKEMLFESGYYFKNLKPKNLYKKNYYQVNFNKFFFNKENLFQGKVNFFLRGKGKKYQNNRFIDNIRDSRSIDDYKKTIEYLVENKWQVYLTGEITEIPKWINKMGNAVVYNSKTKINLDEYNLFVLSNAQVFIGGSSGPPLFNLINNHCKTLILETKHLGISYLNSVVSYPKINFQNLSQLEEILMKCPYDNEYIEKIYKSGLIEILEPNQLMSITQEFIENINNKKYGVKSKDLGFYNTQLFQLDAKISNYWLNINGLNFPNKQEN